MSRLTDWGRSYTSLRLLENVECTLEAYTACTKNATSLARENTDCDAAQRVIADSSECLSKARCSLSATPKFCEKMSKKFGGRCDFKCEHVNTKCNRMEYKVCSTKADALVRTFKKSTENGEVINCTHFQGLLDTSLKCSDSANCGDNLKIKTCTSLEISGLRLSCPDLSCRVSRSPGQGGATEDDLSTPAVGKSGLSGGVIAVIVLCVLAVFGAMLFGLYTRRKKLASHDSEDPEKGIQPEPQQVLQRRGSSKSRKLSSFVSSSPRRQPELSHI
mmetsp:Transcript_20123/g.33230  ORF Transcript_20123/g.33230 Transcript_20123/m.33230 type:complete len:275 (-) Transcript_20123:40-864(-)